ncbi:MAG: hypothetical protein OHK0040_00980 [bacterium]
MPGPIRYRLLLTNILILLLISLSNAFSAEWRISPIRVELSPQDKSASITVFNEDKSPINFQVKAMSWTQDENGKDNYVESEDIIFFPKVFTLEPNKERLIRIGLKNINPVKEKTYRLFVEEIPSSEKKEGVAVQIALRFGIPIFVKPLKEETKWEIINKKFEKGNFEFQIENKGNQHFNIHYVKIKGYVDEKSAKEVLSKEIKGWYVLSGSKRRFSEKIEDCSKIKFLTFQIVADKFTTEEKIEVKQENCF